MRLWLPDGAMEDSDAYPVVYMFDGHNLFRDEWGDLRHLLGSGGLPGALGKAGDRGGPRVRPGRGTTA